MTGGNPIDNINRISGQPPSSPDGAQRVLASANSGHLVFDPATGESLLNTLNHIIDELDRSHRLLFVTGRPAKLGTTVGAQIISRFNQEVAATGAKAFAPAHDQFRQSIATTAEAVRIAMANYASSEQHNTQSFQQGH